MEHHRQDYQLKMTLTELQPERSIQFLGDELVNLQLRNSGSKDPLVFNIKDFADNAQDEGGFRQGPIKPFTQEDGEQTQDFYL